MLFAVRFGGCFFQISSLMYLLPWNFIEIIPDNPSNDLFLAVTENICVILMYFHLLSCLQYS